MRVLYTIASLRKSAGGTTRAVSDLSREVARLGVPVKVMTLDAEGSVDDDHMLPPKDLVSTRFVPAYRLPCVGTLWSPSFRRILQQRIERDRITLIHDHGLWLPTNHSAARVAHKLGIPLILSTHGMLDPWALNHRRCKKRFAWWGYQQKDLRSVSVLHATAAREAEGLRRLGFRQPIAIIPNGIDLPMPPPRSNLAEPLHMALFLGRIHPVKGLLELVEAWRIARPAGWRMIIAGPNEDGFRSAVEERIRCAGLDDHFEFLGGVEDAEKAALYRRADLFILPSFTENFGVVVAEALASGIPVIATKGTPWDGIEKNRCGWWVDLAVESLASAIREATTLHDAERAAMGERGRLYVRHFSWPQVAHQMLAVYQWMAGRLGAPECVLME